MRIDWDESYPVFFFTDDEHGTEIELTAKETRRFIRASDEWEAVQALVRERIGWRD